eukprot:5275157-Amphidinium_carterae.1
MVEPESYCYKTKLERTMTQQAQQYRSYLVPKITEALQALQLWTRSSPERERDRSQSSSSTRC